MNGDNMPHSTQPQNEALLGNEITEENVDRVLSILRQKPLFVRFSDGAWDKLSLNLRHFIETTAYEASPSDPFQREQVASAMLGMWILLSDTQSEHVISQMIDQQ
jgi:hypothetical protein